jgi:hypothetical protein
MSITFPCPIKIEEMTLVEGGYFCGDCNKKVYDITHIKNRTAYIGKCVVLIEDDNEEVTPRQRKHLFALALFIVMGSTLITNNSIQAKNLLQTTEKIKSELIQNDSIIYLKGKIVDKKNRPIDPVDLKITLANGVEMYDNILFGNFNFEIPKHQKNKIIKLSISYYGETKTLEVLMDEDYLQKIENVVFERNKKDNYKKVKKEFDKYLCLVFFRLDFK